MPCLKMGPRAVGDDGSGEDDGKGMTLVGTVAIGAKAMRTAGRLTILEFSGAPLLARPLQRRVRRQHGARFSLCGATSQKLGRDSGRGDPSHER